MGNFKEFVIDFILNAINGFDADVNSAVTILSENIFSTSNPMFNFAMQVNQMLIPVALNITVIIFLLEFLKITVQMEILKWEYLFKVIIKFILAKVALSVSYSLLSAIYATGAGWVSSIGGVSGGTLGGTIGVYMENELNAMGFWDVLGVAVSMLIVILAINIVGTLVQVMAFARTFEIMVNISVSSIPCAFLPSEEGSTSRIAKRFFLNFAGITIQGLIMIICIKLYGVLAQSVLVNSISSGNFGDLAYSMLLGSLVLVMAIVKSGQWAKGIFDL